MDIRHFLTKYPKCVSFESKVSKLVNSIDLRPTKIVDALVRDDLVRQQHDRSKKDKREKISAAH